MRDFFKCTNMENKWVSENKKNKLLRAILVWLYTYIFTSFLNLASMFLSIIFIFLNVYFHSFKLLDVKKTGFTFYVQIN